MTLLHLSGMILFGIDTPVYTYVQMYTVTKPLHVKFNNVTRTLQYETEQYGSLPILIRVLTKKA